jgi:TolB-like protein
MQDLFKRVRERKLVQWALAYLAGAWLLLQVAHLVGQSFGWPGWILRGLIAFLAAGLLAVLVLAWFHGERGHQRVSGLEALLLSGTLLIAAATVVLVMRVGGVGGSDVSGPPGVVIGSDGRLAGGFPANGREATGYGASVAVLPFDDLGASGSGEYFTEGITEEIIGELARIEGLKVISRTSVVALKGSRLTLPQIADTLGVRHVLQGAVRRSGDRIRVTVQLIDPMTDAHIWFETFDRLLDDIFSVQEEVAGQVGRALLARMDVLDPRGTASRTGQSAAYDAFLRGTYARQRHSPERLQEAIEAFEQAIALDSTFAPAQASLSSAHTLWALFAYPGGRDLYQRAALAIELAQRATALDPTLAEGHAALGHARMRAGMPIAMALDDLERAVSLAPSWGEARLLHAVTLAAAGRFEDALQAAEIAVALDPLSPGAHDFLAVSLTLMGRYEDAITEARAARALEPRFPNPRRQEARALLLLGRHEECVGAEVGPFLGLMASCLHATGAVAEARSVADSLATIFSSRDGSFPLHRGAIALELAEYHAWIGDVDGALGWLRRGAELWPVNLITIQVPTFAEVHRDPRFRRGIEEIRQGVLTRVTQSGHAIRSGTRATPRGAGD